MTQQQDSVEVVFAVSADTSPGDQVCVVGNNEVIGNWDPASGVSLSTGPDLYPVWEGIAKIPRHLSELEYKYVRLKAGGDVDWEGLCLNRRLVLAAAGPSESGKGALRAAKRPPRFGEPGKMDESPFEANSPIRTGATPTSSRPDTPISSRPSTPERSFSPPSPLPKVNLTTGQRTAAAPLSSMTANANGLRASPRAAANSSDPKASAEVEIEALCRRTAPGDIVVVIGSIASIGSWSPEKALVLTTSSNTYPKWAGVVTVPGGMKEFEFKFAIRRANGGHDWENTSNRRVVLPSSGKQENGEKWVVKVAFEGPVKNAEDVMVKKTSVLRDGPGHSGASDASTKSNKTVASMSSREGSTKGKDMLAPQRCASASNLFLDSAPLGAHDLSFGRRTSPNQEEYLTFRLPEALPDNVAEGLRVEVVVESDSSKHRMHYQKMDCAWVVAVEKLELPAGIHLFYFLIEDVRVLCPYLPVFNNCNAELFSSSLRRYIMTQGTLEADHARNLEPANPIGPLSRSGSVNDAMPDKSGLSKRPYSIAFNLNQIGDDDEDEYNKPSRHPTMIFKPEVFEGLYDVELKLRLDGISLPKGPVGLQEPVKLWCGAHVLKKGSGPCEDAFFIGPNTMGVADGVGCMVQFAEYGVNAAAYAAELMENASNWLQAGQGEREPDQGPADRAKGAMWAAEVNTQAYGASTIVVLVAEGGEIGVANLGDSGFMILRKSPHGFIVVEESEEQQHSWNCPYQLTRLPPALRAKFPRLNLDSSTDCKVYTHVVRQGDLILLFSDGLRDNLHDREILHITDCALSPTYAELTGMLDKATPPEVLAKSLALAAYERSLDLTAKTPFSENARKHGFECQGGKQDDITVVAGWVLLQEPPPENSLEEVTMTAIQPAIEEARKKAAAAEQQKSEAATKLTLKPVGSSVKEEAAAAAAASGQTDEVPPPLATPISPSSSSKATPTMALPEIKVVPAEPTTEAAQAEAAEATATATPDCPEQSKAAADEALPQAAKQDGAEGLERSSPDMLYDCTNESAEVRHNVLGDAALNGNSDKPSGKPPQAEVVNSGRKDISSNNHVPVVSSTRLHSSSARAGKATLPPYDAGRAEVARRRRVADCRPVSKAKQ